MPDAETTETTEETPALPGDSLREGIVDELRRRLGDSVVAVELRPNDDLWVRIATDAWASAGAALREMGFHYFCFLSGIDWMPSPYGRGEDNPDEPAPERSTAIVQGVTGGETRFQVFARVTDIVRHVSLTLKVDVADDDLRVPSWSTIYAGANWHERETGEMFGIEFVGHPDPRHMYLPGDFEGHPLRKDFPLLSRMVKPWPGIVDVEPMLVEETAGDGASEAPPADAIEGDPAPENPTPTQSDAGVGAAPAEDVAAAAAEEHSVEEAPDHVDPPANEARTDPGDVFEGRSDETPDGRAAVESLAHASDAEPTEPAGDEAVDIPPTTSAQADHESDAVEHAEAAAADAETAPADAAVTETMAQDLDAAEESAATTEEVRAADRTDEPADEVRPEEDDSHD